MQTDLPNLKVLLVEDQRDSRAILRDMLSTLGITQVYEADDGRTGLQFMKSAPDIIDVILCDWNMPSMSGLDFLQQIRSTGEETPFLMITGRSDQFSVVEAKNGGASAYIRKPFTPEQIEAKLRILMQRMKAA